jgi:hypothetical protein
LPLISKDVLVTQDAQLAALAGVGFTAVWKGFLAVKTTETLTFTAVANGTVSLSIDDKVCGVGVVCYVLVSLSMISRIATDAHKRSNIAGHRNLQRHHEHCGGVRHALLRLPAVPA